MVGVLKKGGKRVPGAPPCPPLSRTWSSRLGVLLLTILFQGTEVRETQSDRPSQTSSRKNQTPPSRISSTGPRFSQLRSRLWLTCRWGGRATWEPLATRGHQHPMCGCCSLAEFVTQLILIHLNVKCAALFSFSYTVEMILFWIY